VSQTELRQLDETSPSVQAHLGIIQNVVQRMAANSAGCKTWCVTIVAAILVLIADKGKPQLVLLAVLPILIFGALDVYYLHLEKGFRTSYNDFITKVHERKLQASDLYSLVATGSTKRLVIDALKSFSVWGFYVPLLVLAALTIFIIEPDSPAARDGHQVPNTRYQHYR
jgi:hypothetical protein